MNQTQTNETDIQFSIRQIRKLIVLPVVFFALSVFLILMFVVARQWITESKVAKIEIERTVHGQINFLTSEVFFQQKEALTRRFEMIVTELEAQHPNWKVCYLLKSKNDALSNCSKEVFKNGSSVVTQELTIGNQKLASLEIRAELMSSEKLFILKILLISLLLSALLVVILVFFLGATIEAQIVAPLLQRIRETSRKAGIAETASQVAHDIRSPLSALEMVLKDLSALSEEQRYIIRIATQRIKDIANNLLEKNRAFLSESEEPAKAAHQSQKLTIQLISNLLDTIVSEKRTQYRTYSNLEIDLELANDGYGTFASVDSREMKRLMSNLINNAVEALHQKLKDKNYVKVFLTSLDNKFLKIEVVDNGKGIPPSILNKLGQRGVSYGKDGTDSGSGLGVFHARKSIESWGGQFKIESQLSRGTTVSIVLPKAAPPDWFVEEIILTPTAKVAVLDDDNSIYRVWIKRFAAWNTVEVEYFSTQTAFEAWLNKNQPDILLCDYELLGEKESGIDVIERLDLNHISVLVTSRFEDIEIQNRCVQIGLKLLPKSLASIVPIRVG